MHTISISFHENIIIPQISMRCGIKYWVFKKATDTEETQLIFRNSLVSIVLVPFLKLTI